jgi:hypothetical protein
VWLLVLHSGVERAVAVVADDHDLVLADISCERWSRCRVTTSGPLVQLASYAVEDLVFAEVEGLGLIG